jgi:hypothetical protein
MAEVVTKRCGFMIGRFETMRLLGILPGLVNAAGIFAYLQSVSEDLVS